ncbi:hypothetical protein R0V13_01790 [Facklamia hominis]|uniref:hypothetical protein n=1 Tax=Facklamia hominis TaxID=178214 RepID=UPI0029D41410|nr:hypothetical protein [Facklamia hominis]WPJ91130.1 hypothetical protein R0V13_01790 [Facklamia hominis]
MQCPNCGRHVRSKTQCAYCGYQFNSSDKKEFNREPASERPDVKRDEIKEDKDIISRTKKDQSSRSQEVSSNTLEADAPVASSKEEKPARRARISVARRSLEAEMAKPKKRPKKPIKAVRVERIRLHYLKRKPLNGEQMRFFLILMLAMTRKLILTLILMKRFYQAAVLEKDHA